MKYIDGGVCAAKGFKAGGMHCGVKSNNPEKKDVAVILSDCDCSVSAVFTKNVVKAAPIHITKAHISDGVARAVLVNSGNANACAPHGEENAEKCCKALATELGIPAENVVVASTGVIGQTLPVDVIIGGISEILSGLSYDGSDAAAQAIMTTDTVKKECAVETVIGGTTV
ncbi:MAG: bifunctional ornithine acetyltransferase/N-acetylglutamate synthase, partial [Oscillospiraceae bacterium]|nr:bifunctional ornithine acetyltransferase/N-acetylglutamate synthase [Oscillospiraceae bacterium]